MGKPTPLNIGIIILSGGKGTRVNGQDKGWCLYQGEPYIKKVLKQLQTQEQALADNFTITISANRNLSAYRQQGVEVVADLRKDYCGPLSGIESVIKKNKNSHIDRWIIYPVDSVHVPNNYLSLMSKLSKNQTSYIVQDEQAHFAHLSISNLHQSSLSDYLNTEQRSIKGWLKQVNATPLTLCLEGETISNFNSC